MTLNNDDFPTLGRPTIPIFKLFEGRPNLGLFSTGAPFFGGIFFLASRGEEEEKYRVCERRGLVLTGRRIQIKDMLFVGLPRSIS